MVQCLREGYLYSEKRARDFLFDAFARCLRDHGPLALIGLTRLATRAATHQASEAGFPYGNWTVAGRTVANAMLRARAFVTVAGATLEPGLAAQAEPIHSLHPDFRDRTEAYLLSYLAERMGDLTDRDHVALAHALFRQFDARVSMEAYEERVVALLGSLGGTLAVDPAGRYVPKAAVH